jgi:LmbE family N-acetylglucosaminyl deacetylase
MNILAIGAHPDDIEIGCGGTLLKYARAGHNVHLLVLTEGNIGGEPSVRKSEQEKVAGYIGAKGLFFGGYRDTELTDNRDLILTIEQVKDKTDPDIVFVNYSDDTHQDHRATCTAAVSATRYVKEVLFYEVPSSYSFNPRIFVDIEAVLNDKMELLRLHASQFDKTRVKNLNIEESAHACAVFRGYQGRVKFAEGFKPLRIRRDIV